MATVAAAAAVTLPLFTAGCGPTPGPAATAPAVTTAAPSAAAATPRASTAAPSGTATTSPAGTATAVPAAPSGTPATTAPPTSLHPGERGPQVLALQKQLAAAGYWLGTPDGTYGQLTEQAVLALQKAVGLPRDGVAGASTLKALAAGTVPTPHSHSGRVLEVDLTRQVVLVVSDGKVEQVLNTSTGSGRSYVSQGATHRAVTPAGSFAISRQIDGIRHAPLGNLYRPKYFNGGIAFHGYSQVPAYPASHGCVRLTNAAMDWMWTSGVAQIGTSVLVYA